MKFYYNLILFNLFTFNQNGAVALYSVEEDVEKTKYIKL